MTPEKKTFKILTFGCHPNEKPRLPNEKSCLGTKSFSNSDRQQPQVIKENLQKGSESLENQTKKKKKSGRNNTMHGVVDNFLKSYN